MAIHDIQILQSGGFSEQQALAVARYVEQAQQTLVTKADLEVAVLRIAAEIKDGKVDTLREIKDGKVETIRWVSGLLMAQVVAMLGLVKILFKL